MTAIPRREDLAKAFNNNEPVIRAIEALFRALDTNTAALTTGVAATEALQDATVLTLSSNTALNNERIVEQGNGIQLTDTGSALVIALANILFNGNSLLTLNLPGNASLTVIQSGTVMTEENASAVLAPYTNNAAAIAAGLSVGSFYRISGGSGDQMGVVH